MSHRSGLKRPVVAVGATLLALTGCAPATVNAQGSSAAPSAALLEIDLEQRAGEMYPMWAYFGYDEPNYTYSWAGKKLLDELAELSPVPVFVRAHNLLTTDEGPRSAFKWGSTNAYTEDANGNPVSGLTNAGFSISVNGSATAGAVTATGSPGTTSARVWPTPSPCAPFAAAASLKTSSTCAG